VLAKATFGGRTATDTAVAANTDVTFATISNLTPGPNNLRAQLTAYAPALDQAKFNCGAYAIQRTFAMFVCLRGSQDSYGWLAVYNFGNGLPIGSGGNGAVVAAMAHWSHPKSRWCMVHAPLDNGHVPVMTISNQFAKGGGVGLGRYEMRLQTPMPATEAVMTINVTSTCSAGSPACQPGDPVSPNPDEWLMGLAVNDLFGIGGEVFRVTAKSSSTSITVQRNYTLTGATAHAVNDPIGMICNAQVFLTANPSDRASSIQTTEMNWAFLQAPNPSATSIYYGLRTVTASHTGYRAPFWFGDSYNVITGDASDPATWTLPPIYASVFDPPFAGIAPVEDPNRFETHPSYQNNFAVGVEKNWIVDAHPFIGIIANSVTPVTGALYRYALREGDGTLHRKHVPTFAFSGNKILRDVSGPSSVITGNASDAYKYCVALSANECMGGSVAGDIYVNVPASVTLSCPPSPPVVADFCINDKGFRGMSVGQALIQPGLTPAQTSTTQRALMRLFIEPRVAANTSNVKSLPDGSWLMWGGLLIKNPGQPTADGVDRTTFVPTLINVPAPTVAGVVSAVIEFGYHEDGSPTSYWCTSRADTCVADSSTVRASNPFKFKSVEATPGVPCALGCTIAIPAIPQRIVYWAVKYRDATGSVVAVGPKARAWKGHPYPSGTRRGDDRGGLPDHPRSSPNVSVSGQSVTFTATVTGEYRDIHRKCSSGRLRFAFSETLPRPDSSGSRAE